MERELGVVMRSPKLDNLLGRLALGIDHDHRTLALQLANLP
jgi:hypothetical protein